ncbi:MAG: EH signature domain-containing protein [Pseudomonadota bacterium]
MISLETFRQTEQLLRANLKDLSPETIANWPTTPETRLKDLAAVVASLDVLGMPSRPPRTPDYYLREWADYIGGRHDLSPAAFRHLCWEPDVATSEPFLLCLQADSKRVLSRKGLRGLAYSIHALWSKRGSLGDSVKLIRQFLRDYAGFDTAINKWRTNIDSLFDLEAHHALAARLLEQGQKPDAFFREHSLFPYTEFYWAVLQAAITNSLEAMRRAFFWHTHRLPSLLEYCLDLLSEEELPTALFKNTIAQIILSPAMENQPLADRVKEYVLDHKKLGDPRLRHNGIHWAGIDEAAKDKIVQWLSRADIIFFFEHVMQRGEDRHGRKDFWLRYEKKFRNTRCLLSPNDKARLSSVFHRRESRIEGYGSVRGGLNQSAFLLDFGSVLAIEFHKVGACYVYKRPALPDVLQSGLRSSEHFWEGELKDQDAAADRIVHRHGWQEKMAQCLARHQIWAG